jgi:hypothetical protein
MHRAQIDDEAVRTAQLRPERGPEDEIRVEDVAGSSFVGAIPDLVVKALDKFLRHCSHVPPVSGVEFMPFGTALSFGYIGATGHSTRHTMQAMQGREPLWNAANPLTLAYQTLPTSGIFQ